jgi:hypothetical protein
VSDPQTAGYRPTPISQRDGSPLANSNCRMASIATGLDYDTRGAKRSTGAKMRELSGDTSGGTNSSGARTAWDRGYSETLTVRDGHTFDDALADLRAGRMVHLDVWAATLGGPCLSGSGAYGHTIAVLPDYTSSGWSVADPWCSPGRWAREPESQLRAAAEQWGRDVYGTTAGEPDYPTGDRDPRSAAVLAIVERVVARLMSERYPGGPTLGEFDVPDELAGLFAETAGGQPILYTVTAAIAPGGDDSVTITQVKGEDWRAKNGVLRTAPDTAASQITTLPAGTIVRSIAEISSAGSAYSWRLTEHGGSPAYFVYKRLSDGSIPDFDPISSPGVDAALSDYIARVPSPAGPDVAERDEEWREWLLEGSPGSSD